MPTPQPKVEPITVRELLAHAASRLELNLATRRADLDRTISSRDVQVPGLALAGRRQALDADRIQILGPNELALFDDADAVLARIERGGWRRVPAVVVARGLEPPPELVAWAESEGVPLLATPLRTSEIVPKLQQELALWLAPRIRVHGVLVDVFGVGLLLLGDSGVGKSECALDLVTRGHRLVADDCVEIRCVGEELIGSCPDRTRHKIEVRGLGIINACRVFGVAAVRDAIPVARAVRLVRFEDRNGWDRLGDTQRRWGVLGHEVPLTELPVAPGRHLAVLLEVAARQHQMAQQEAP